MLNYPGHCLHGHGIRPDEAKVKAVTQLQPPSNATDLRRMFGMIRYLGRYLMDLSEVAKPLNDLLKTMMQNGHGLQCTLINCKDFDSVPMMCQTLLLHMMHYNSTTVYKTGKQLTITDI